MLQDPVQYQPSGFGGPQSSSYFYSMKLYKIEGFCSAHITNSSAIFSTSSNIIIMNKLSAQATMAHKNG